MLQLRKKIAFYLEDWESPVSLSINLVIFGLILLSLVIFVAQTYSLPSALSSILNLLDLTILVVFTLEYFLRFWIADNKYRFLFNIFSLIDLLAILPLLLGIMDFRFMRIFRWFRILRIIRFLNVKTRLFGIETEDGIIFARIFLTLFSLIFVYAGIIYQLEHQINHEGLKNFFDALYFVVVTMTTVGYGDVTPISEIGKAMTLVMILTGVLFIPWQLSELIKQVLKTMNLVEKECPNCGLSRHDYDAKFCKKCGASLTN
jgi:voltage-gated potassium channel